jgi:hypothetical protein
MIEKGLLLEVAVMAVTLYPKEQGLSINPRPRPRPLMKRAWNPLSPAAMVMDVLVDDYKSHEIMP